MQPKPPFGQKGPDPRELFKKAILGMRDDTGKRVVPYKEQQRILKKKK